MMRKIWTRSLAVCLVSMATLTVAGIWAQQEPPAPSQPDQGGTANGRPGGGGMVERRLENLTQQLNLTSEQKDKIRPLLKHEMERIREIRSNTNLSQGEARQRMEMVRRITRAHIAEILTPEQKKQFQEMREEHHGEGGPGGGQRGPGSPGGSDTPPSPQDTPNLIR